MTTPPQTTTPQHRKDKAEAMAMRFMAPYFNDFDSEFGKAVAKGHRVVMAQARAKVVERWKNAIHMSLLCLESTDEAIEEFDRIASDDGTPRSGD